MTAQTRLDFHAHALNRLRPFLKAAIRGALSPEALTHQVNKEGSHIIFLVGHMAWAIDKSVLDVMGGAPSLDAEGDAPFRFGSKPSPNPDDYPSLAEAVGRFNTAIDGFIAHLATMDDATLDNPPPEDSFFHGMFPDLNDVLHHIVFHTSYHIGQVTTLRRAQEQGGGFGV